MEYLQLKNKTFHWATNISTQCLNYSTNETCASILTPAGIVGANLWAICAYFPISQPNIVLGLVPN